MKDKKVYLDGAANTPIDKNVLKAMMPYMKQSFVGNSFATHDFGIAAGAAVESSRNIIADSLRVDPEDVIFTSGASEGNNMVIRSVPAGKKIVCGATEHSSVFNTCKFMQTQGVDVVFVQSNASGTISVSDIKNAIDDNTVLVCLMAVNNELGTCNNITEASFIAHRHGALLLCDCTQQIGYGGEESILGAQFRLADFMTFSGHKIYGPTGTGCLIARKEAQSFLKPLIIAGSQEKGLRGGTSNTFGIVGLAEAVKEIVDLRSLPSTFYSLFSYMKKRLEKYGKLNAMPDHNNISSWNFSKSFNSDKLAAVFALRGIAVSAGSACDTEHDETAGDFNGSHVLMALGLTPNEIRNTVRISFTKYTTVKDIDYLVAVIEDEIERSKNESSR